MAVALSDIEKDAKFCFLEMTFLTKAEKSILNAAGTSGGNLTELKKTTEIDNTQRIFVSGSSVKWSIKKYWEENQMVTGEQTSGIDEKIASIGASQADSATIGAQISSKCDPSAFIDDDLFGYFNTNKNLARNAPVKTSGMISIFNVGPDIDNLVRYSPTSQDHSLFDKEISTNVFRSSWAIELDRIGKTSSKLESKGNPLNLPIKTRERRVKLFFQAIFNLWLRTQQTNYLTNTQPELMIVIFRQDKSLVIGNKLSIDKHYNVGIKSLEEVLDYHKDKISLGYIAFHESFITNHDDLKNTLNGKVGGKLFTSTLVELKEKLLSDEFKFIREEQDIKADEEKKVEKHRK